MFSARTPSTHFVYLWWHAHIWFVLSNGRIYGFGFDNWHELGSRKSLYVLIFINGVIIFVILLLGLLLCHRKIYKVRCPTIICSKVRTDSSSALDGHYLCCLGVFHDWLLPIETCRLPNYWLYASVLRLDWAFACPRVSDFEYCSDMRMICGSCIWCVSYAWF